MHRLVEINHYRDKTKWYPSGKLIPVTVSLKSMGGGCVVNFVCDGCKKRKINLRSSAAISGSRQTVLGQALALAFIVSGFGYTGFERTMKEHLGMQVLGSKSFTKLIENVLLISLHFYLSTSKIGLDLCCVQSYT